MRFLSELSPIVVIIAIISPMLVLINGILSSGFTTEQGNILGGLVFLLTPLNWLLALVAGRGWRLWLSIGVGLFCVVVLVAGGWHIDVVNNPF
jgi:hypothetical protein